MTDAGRVPLRSRVWIGDTRTGALVAADGTVDWYCPVRFAAPAALCRLLDPAGGAVRIGPVRAGRDVRRRLPAGTQRYRSGTLVAETEMEAIEGLVRVTDVMPWSGPGITPPGRIVRIATALAGPVDLEIEVIPGGSWGPARRVSSWSEGLVGDGLVVRTTTELHPEPLDRDHPRWRGVTRLDAGESVVVTIDAANSATHRPLSVDAARHLADETAVAWRSWGGMLAYAGEHRGAVERAALCVRALTPAGGAAIGAGTTSLPRRPGGERNADDRFVRWRDAAAAARILALVGLNEDAEEAERWLRRATEGADRPWAQILDADGGAIAEREELPLAGWRSSQPVVTSARPDVVDLDLYGDVVAAVSASRLGPVGEGGDGPLVGAWPALVTAADWLTDNWRQPDAGVWGSEGPVTRLVASAVQGWSALDGMARRARAANPLDLAAVVWQHEACEILRWLETEGLATEGGLQRSPSPTDHPDAALLRVAWQGPWPPTHPIVVATVDRTLKRLASGPLVYRLPEEVDDGVSGADSPDLLASLWAVKALTCLQRWEDAHQRFEAIVGLGGTLGLLSEAADPISGELLGNLPATAVHLALIDAALALDAGPR